MKRMCRRKADTDNTVGISGNMIHCAILFNKFLDIVKTFISIKGKTVKSQDVNMVGSINPNRSLENDKKLFLMTAIRKTALYMLDS